MPDTQNVEQSNCPACAKSIEKAKRYYRNEKYYCNKKCWRKALTSKKS